MDAQVHPMPTRAQRPSRWNFLRLRLAATAVGLLVLAVGLLPWLLMAALTQVEGGLRLLVVVGCTLLGLLMLPVAWIGTLVLRLAWRPLQIWAPIRRDLRW